ncbi:MAG: hypothetical protein Q9M15_04695, partial [Mariprofundaceae bacterium]|nr:hypothetical protein [Mariprofundaceae bacterium]
MAKKKTVQKESLEKQLWKSADKLRKKVHQENTSVPDIFCEKKGDLGCQRAFYTTLLVYLRDMNIRAPVMRRR